MPLSSMSFSISSISLVGRFNLALRLLSSSTASRSRIFASKFITRVSAADTLVFVKSSMSSSGMDISGLTCFVMRKNCFLVAGLSANWRANIANSSRCSNEISSKLIFYPLIR